MANTVHDDTECVIYTENFLSRIHGNILLPHQTLGKITLLDYLNQTEKITLTRFSVSHRQGLNFVHEPESPLIDYNDRVHLPTHSICLLHGYPQYGFLSKSDDQRLQALHYEEIPIFLRYYVDAHHAHELICGRMLAKIHGIFKDAVSAQTGALEEAFKTRPRFLALRRPSSPLLVSWFEQEDQWKTRPDHQLQPTSIILNQRRISFYGLQKLEAPVEQNPSPGE